MAHALAVLGSASDVGKSLVTAGLCRLLADAGVKVAPYKAQNMANQAGVTADGLEMPRAQILQARACRVEPHVDMGPVLIKPVSATSAEIVVLGRAAGQREARDYFRDTSALAAVAFDALDRLAARFDLIVMEGAGSPVELNLMARDFVNLAPARRLDARLVLVLDIDKGGVFAQACGTLDLLPPADRARVVGVLVNRFRGDPDLFEDGIALLEQRCGTPVLGVIPHIEHGLDEEDRPLRVPVDEAPRPGRLHVGAVLSPRVSNTEDLWPLLAEADVQLTWITDPRLALAQDLLVLPGAKATIADLAVHASTGMASALVEAHRQGAWVLGLCGGYQMMGRELCDDAGTEGGPRRWDGLGLLPIATVFRPEKTTRPGSWPSAWPAPGPLLSGYEIHHGESSGAGRALVSGGGAEIGLVGERAVGCYLHGLLGNDGWRAAFLNEVRRTRGLPPREPCTADPLELRLSRWAAHLRDHLRPGAWERIVASLGG
jgi:adenosylcobyric acid synthase